MTPSSTPAAVRLGLFAVVFAATTAAAQGDAEAVHSTRGMVVSVSAPASDVGAAMLARGGNAVDAAVATAFALSVTHPSAGNIGGGGFMVIRLPDGKATTIDYRERAPLSATPMLFAPGGTLIRALGDTGWLAAGVPGTVRGLELAHKKFGKLPWSEVVRPAAELAARGWPLSPALARSLNGFVGGRAAKYPTTVAAYGRPGGGQWQPGDTIRLPDLSRALRAIMTDGPNAFYSGWIADSLVSQERANHGPITKADLAQYRAVEREPLRGSFLGYDIIAMGPPTSGGQVVIETLNILEPVVDASGMAVSNTFTLQGGFGNGIVIGGAGFLLNNEMGDFNRYPGITDERGDIGTPPNLIGPGKRMLSSMSPVILTKNGQLALVTGSPGGRTIPNTVLDVVLGYTAFKMDVRQAVDAPRLHNQWLPDTTRVEQGIAADAVLAELRAKGEAIAPGRGAQGDAHSISYDPKTHTATGARDRRTPDSKASAPPAE